MSVLTLTARHTISWGMPQALALLDRVQGWNLRRPGHLPPAILDWIERLEQGFHAPKELQAPCTPLELDCGPTRARPRLLRKNSYRIIVVEELGTTIAPDQLASLGLTNRESEVWRWGAQGKTNDEIGHIIGCSHRTVQKHLERIYIKLGLENRTAAAMMAVEPRAPIAPPIRSLPTSSLLRVSF